MKIICAQLTSGIVVLSKLEMEYLKLKLLVSHRDEVLSTVYSRDELFNVYG